MSDYEIARAEAYEDARAGLTQPTFTAEDYEIIGNLMVCEGTILAGTNIKPTAIMLTDDILPGLEQFRSLPVVRGPMNALVYEPVRRETCSDDTCLENHS